MQNSQDLAIIEEKRRLMYLSAAALLLLAEEERIREEEKKEVLPPPRKRKARTTWVREWVTRRHSVGHYDQLLTELHREDRQGYKIFLRITPEVFQEMVDKLSPHLEKKKTFMREPLEVDGLKLATTLRFLATGDCYSSLQYSFRVPVCSICKFLPEVCQAIIDVVKGEVLRCPRTPQQWKEVAQGFSSRWNYNNCLGALDGKHVAMRKPPNAGSFYFNYKGVHSIVLMALVDSGYKFLYVDAGAEGGASDGGTWSHSSLHEAVEQKQAGLPEAAPLPNDDKPVPYHFVADDAFALKTWLMKPFSHRSQNPREIIYSYRLSRARRVVENAFEILSQRFRCFASAMQQHPDIINVITMCACVLHNLILTRCPLSTVDVDHEDATTHDLVPGAWRQGHQLAGLMRLGPQNSPRQAKEQREYLSHYYLSPAGQVPWQEKLLHNCPKEV